MPTYSIPLEPHSTTAFTPPVQLMRVGDAWVKYTFTVGTESASLPLKVHVKRLYPVLGVLGPLPAGPDDTQDRPYGLGWVALHDIHGPEECAILNWNDEPQAEDIVKKWDPPLVEMIQPPPGLGSAEAQATFLLGAYQELTQKVAPLGQDTALVSPCAGNGPWVTPSDQGLQADPLMKAAFEAGLGKYVQSVGVRLHPLPQAGALLEKIDGKAPAANLYWANFNRQYDFTGLRTFLAANQAQLPLLLNLWDAQTGGTRLHVLATARLMLEATWQGSTGTVVDDQTPVSSQYVGELWRELAGAQPVYLTPTEDGSCSRAPDAPVSYWPFLRGDEGIVFMANNTSAPQDLAVEVRGAPVQLQVLRISAFGAPVTRQIEGIFRFGQEAQHRHVQTIYLRLAPGEIVGLAVTLHGADLGWLRSIGRRPVGAYMPAQGPQPLQEPDTDPWVVEGARF
jgi:hypothetical protein